MNKIQSSNQDFKQKFVTDKDIKDSNGQIDYAPGLNEPRLQIGVNVKGNTVVSGIYKTLLFTKNAADGIGVVNYTGFGFNPTGFIIEAWRIGTASGPCFSYAIYQSGTISGHYTFPGSYNSLSTRPLVVYYTGSSSTRADFDSFITDGIALDFISSDIDIAFTITAF